MSAVISLSLMLLLAVDAYADAFESTHLVTMRKAELMEILDCLSKSLNPALCTKFFECEKFLPQQVLIATEECKKKCVVGDLKKCSPHEPLFKSPEIPHKIFDCVVENTHKLNAEESKMMVEFEKCARDFHAVSCKFPKHFDKFH